MKTEGENNREELYVQRYTKIMWCVCIYNQQGKKIKACCLIHLLQLTDFKRCMKYKKILDKKKYIFFVPYFFSLFLFSSFSSFLQFIIYLPFFFNAYNSRITDNIDCCLVSCIANYYFTHFHVVLFNLFTNYKFFFFLGSNHSSSSSSKYNYYSHHYNTSSN